MADIGFTCGLPAGNDSPTNTEANADSPAGTHDPYGGTTYTPGPSPNVAGMGIAGLNRSRSTPIGEMWVLGWAMLGALLVFAL